MDLEIKKPHLHVRLLAGVEVERELMAARLSPLSKRLLRITGLAAVTDKQRESRRSEIYFPGIVTEAVTQVILETCFSQSLHISDKATAVSTCCSLFPQTDINTVL